MPPLPERMPQRPVPPMPPLPRGADSRGQEAVSEYAKRSVPQGLDQHGRATPVHNQVDDDQLEIPAFLRRQAN
jgi:cell division protein FtsZ